MAYGLKYEAEIAGLDGREWRVRLSLRDYTGTVSEVDPASEFIELFWGDRSDDQITTTHLPGRLILRISDKSGTLWQEFVDADNKTWQVRVQNRSIGDNIWRDSFFGLYVPDTFIDDETDKPNVVRVEFRDGLTLLEDEPFVGPETAEEDLGEVTVVEALHKIFSSLPYQRQFNLLHSLFPHKKNGVQLDGSTDPFSLLTFEEAGLLDDQQLVRSGTLSKKDVLLELCKAFGCTVVQSRGIWWIRQHAYLAKENGTGLRIWRYRGDTGALLSSGTTSIVHDLSEMESRRGRPRFHERRFTQADISFEASTNTGLSDTLFLEETWENASGVWLTEDRWVFEEVSSSDTSVQRALWDLLENHNVVDIRSATGDVQGLWLKTSNEFVSPYARTEGIGAITEQAGDALLKISFDLSYSKSRNTVHFRADIGDYYLDVTPVEVRGRYRAGDVELRVAALPGTGTVLYEGQVIPMTVAGTDPSNGDGVAAFTVSEDAKGGDRRVRGRLSADLMDLTFTQGNFPRLWIYHWAFDDGTISFAQKWLSGLRYLPADFESLRLSGVDLLVPTTTLQGEKVTGDLTCYWGVRKLSTQSGDISVAVGDVSVGLEPKEGSNLTFTRRASVGMEGESVGIDSIFGDRISSNARRGFFLPDQPVVNDWRIDPYPGTVPNGDTLIDLIAKATVAASTGAKRTAELLPRKGQDIILPHEVLEWRDIFSHTRQTLTELVYLPFQGAYEATMQALSWDQQLFDEATLTTPEEAEEGAGSSRNFVVSSAINLSGSGASSWGQLSGKPTNLFARNGGTDGFSETTGLTSSDILTPIPDKVTDWDEAYSWGDHAAGGYLEKTGGTISDILRVENGSFMPEGLLQLARTSGTNASKLAIFHSSSTGFESGASPDATAQLRNENAGFTFSTGDDLSGSILMHLRPDGWVELPSGGITAANLNIFDWDMAHSWGDHAQAGYLEEQDINRADWDEAFGWGDHAQAGYLKETDISRSQWDTAYDRSVTGVSGSGNGTLTISQQVGSVTTDLSHTHATLSAGTGLSGSDYTGATNSTWSLDTSYTDGRYANRSGDSFTGDVEFGDFLRANISKARFEVLSGTTTSVAMGFLDGLPKNQEEGEFWGSDDRGFWVREGDNLVIDGNVEYENGNWLIENDASLKIVDGITGADIIKLGTDSGDKGLFLYSGTDPNDKLVSLNRTGLTINATGSQSAQDRFKIVRAGGGNGYSIDAFSTFDPAINYGDVDGDGVISSSDAASVLQATRGFITLTAAEKERANVFGVGGDPSPLDAYLIQQKVVGLLTTFPVEDERVTVKHEVPALYDFQREAYFDFTQGVNFRNGSANLTMARNGVEITAPDTDSQSDNPGLSVAGNVRFENDLQVNGTVSGSNLNVSDWNAAHSWGDHKQAGYITGPATLSDVAFTNQATSTGSNVEFDTVQLANHEQEDFDENGLLFWDLSAGLYIKSGNADDGTKPRLQWSGDNVSAGSNINISYGNEDRPTISVPSFPSFDDLEVSGVIEAYNITTQGTLDLSGSGGVDVSFGGLTIEGKTAAALQDHLSFSVGNPSPSSGSVGDIRTANNGVWIKVGSGTWLKLTVEQVVT